jgi:hypothetical protein
MPSARRVHFLPKLPAHFTFEVGGVHSISPGGCPEALFIGLPFERFLEIGQNSQPGLFKLADPSLGNLVDRDGIEIVQLLATLFERHDEVGLFEHGQMLHDRLARHVMAFAQLTQCLPVPRMKPVE